VGPFPILCSMSDLSERSGAIEPLEVGTHDRHRRCAEVHPFEGRTQVDIGSAGGDPDHLDPLLSAQVATLTVAIARGV